MLAKITHVIFDFDGVLLDTETIFYKANLHCFQHYGLQYTREIKQGQMGRPLKEGVEWIMKNTQLSEKGITHQVNFLYKIQFLGIYKFLSRSG